MPTAIENSDCPSAISTPLGVRLEKSARNIKAQAAAASPTVQAYTASTASSENKAGIMNLAARSMPLRMPLLTTSDTLSTIRLKEISIRGGESSIELNIAVARAPSTPVKLPPAASNR